LVHAYRSIGQSDVVAPVTQLQDAFSLSGDDRGVVHTVIGLRLCVHAVAVEQIVRLGHGVCAQREQILEGRSGGWWLGGPNKSKEKTKTKTNTNYKF
jgi:hypothetical protein